MFTGSRLGAGAASTSRFSNLTLGHTSFSTTSNLRAGFGTAGLRPGIGYGGYYGNRFGYYGGWGWGGWGFGLGFGWGWGWGLGFGWGWYDPFWYNPYWPNAWGWPGYGYYAPYGYAPPDNQSNFPPPYGPGESNSNSSGATQNDIQPDIEPQIESSQPDDNPNPNTGNVAESAPTVLLYMKDGTTLPATDYWVADGRFHYRVAYGNEDVIDMSQLDLQRTVDENAKRGVRFTLKPQPVPSTPPAPAAATTTSTTT